LNGANGSHLNHLERGVSSLAGKWTAQILWAMKDNPVRLSNLVRTHPSASLSHFALTMLKGNPQQREQTF
jgi:DNA-binding HxlR family transcriptional regulator